MKYYSCSVDRRSVGLGVIGVSLLLSEIDVRREVLFRLRVLSIVVTFGDVRLARLLLTYYGLILARGVIGGC